jgi:hypothetical protein
MGSLKGQKMFLPHKIISCQHCQVHEDGEAVLGIGEPVSVVEVIKAEVPLVCPNCRAKLRESDFVMVDLPWIASTKAISARSGI